MNLTERQLADDAACGGDFRFLEDSPSHERTADLRRVCQACPVLEKCLQVAAWREVGRQHSEVWGIRGGMTAVERAHMMRDATECVICGDGSPRGRREDFAGACDPCAKAVRWERKQERKALDEVAHPKLRCVSCGGPVADHRLSRRCGACSHEDLRDNRWARRGAA